MAPNPQVAKAFRAMKALGISENKVKPVLKRLLKLYDKNWELIEEENYRVLADAIFEEDDKVLQENHEGNDNFEEEEQVLDEPERPLKRLRRGHEGPVTSPNTDSNNINTNNNGSLRGVPLKEPKLEVEELPGSSSIHQPADARKLQSVANSPGSHAIDAGKQPVSQGLLAVQEMSNPSPRQNIDKGKQPLVASPKEKRPVMGRQSHGIRFRDPVVERSIVPLPKQKAVDTQALIQPKEEPYTDDMPVNELPLAVIRPDSSSKKDSSAQRISNGRSDSQLPPATHPVIKDRNGSVRDFPGSTRTNGGTASNSGEPPANLEIATSSSGEVKISLSYISLLERPNFHLPGQDELLKVMQEKCLQSYKIIDPNFSITQMLKDICDCFMELASDSTHESQDRLMSEPPTVDMACGGPGGNKLNDGVVPKGSDAGCSLAVAGPQSPRVALGSNDLQNKESNKEEIVNGHAEQEEQNNSRDPESGRLVVVPESQSTPEQLRAHYLLNDITKGEEVIEVPWINEINIDYLPLFNYIPRSLVFQNADVRFTLSRIGGAHCCVGCSNNCLSSSTSCLCSCVGGDGFAYTSSGLLKEEFLEECVATTRDPQQQCLSYCKDCPLECVKDYETYEPCRGHLKRKYIKECWIKCGCHKQCGNRVVQRGIRCKLQVFFTPDGKDWGLRTLENLPKGAFVCEYVGEILTIEELHERKRTRKSNTMQHAYPVILDAFWFMQNTHRNAEALCLDGTIYGSVARFINHRCLDANLIEIPVKIETSDHHYYHLALFTTREVNALEELTWDYGIDFDDNNRPVEAFRCLCGSKLCRNMKRPSRSKSAIAE